MLDTDKGSQVRKYRFGGTRLGVTSAPEPYRFSSDHGDISARRGAGVGAKRRVARHPLGSRILLISTVIGHRSLVKGSLLHRSSILGQRSSDIRHRALVIAHGSLGVAHSSSFWSSFIAHRSSFIGHLSVVIVSGHRSSVIGQNRP